MTLKICSAPFHLPRPSKLTSLLCRRIVLSYLPNTIPEYMRTLSLIVLQNKRFSKMVEMRLLFMLVLVALASLSDALLIELPLGKVLGESKQGFDSTGRPVNWTSYTGIPFAQPPIGDLRFLPPHPPNSTEQRPPVMCPQVKNSILSQNSLHQQGGRCRSAGRQ